MFGGDRGLYERLSAFDNLRYFAELYGGEPRRQRPRIAELLALAVIAKGEIVAQGTPQQLKARVEQSGVVEVEVEVFGIDEESVRGSRRSPACWPSSSRSRSSSCSCRRRPAPS